MDLEDSAAVRKGVEQVISRFGCLHSVIYAAGPLIEFRYIHEIEPSEWAHVVNADVNGFYNLVAATLPHLRERKKGVYLAVTTAAVGRAPPRDILSAAPKAAIEELVRGLAREEGRNGIRANCVEPGYIEAGMGLSTVHAGTQAFVSKMIGAIPLERAGQAQDVADAAVFLLSEKARYVTGASLPVAGGLQIA
jgi:NAD(P)-dependent dehydrogenase (short-subunit alcohol dehydrogenase family)